MTDPTPRELSSFPEAASLDGTEITVGDKDGQTVNWTVQQIADFIGGSGGGFPITFDDGTNIYTVSVADTGDGTELLLKVADKATGLFTSEIHLNSRYQGGPASRARMFSASPTYGALVETVADESGVENQYINIHTGGNDVHLLTGFGDPNGLFAASASSLFFDTTSPALYQNTDGATAWSLVGSGLPSQWSQGTNGDVTATVDDITKTALTLQAIAGQQATTPLLLLKDENGNSLFFVNQEPGGIGSTVGWGPTPNNAGLSLQLDDQAGNFNEAFFRLFGAGQITFDVFLDVNTPANSQTQMTMDVAPSQVSPVMRIRDASSNVVARIMPDGTLISNAHAAPADGDLNNSDHASWLDDTPGATVLHFKAKDSTGTVRTASVPLT